MADYNKLHAIYVAERLALREERQAHVAEVCRRKQSEAHAVLARQEIERLQNLLNAKDTATNQPKDQVRMTGLVTVGEGLEGRRVQAEARQSKRNADAAKEQAKEDARDQELTRRCAIADDDNHVFDGRLAKKRADWDDIAFCLGINTSSMNIPDIITDISTQLRQRQELQSKPRYQAIWGALSKRAQRAAASTSAGA